MNMIEVLKEEINKFFNEIQGNTNKKNRKIKKTIQDLKLDIESKEDSN